MQNTILRLINACPLRQLNHSLLFLFKPNTDLAHDGQGRLGAWAQSLFQNLSPEVGLTGTLTRKHTHTSTMNYGLIFRPVFPHFTIMQFQGKANGTLHNNLQVGMSGLTGTHKEIYQRAISKNFLSADTKVPKINR